MTYLYSLFATYINPITGQADDKPFMSGWFQLGTAPIVICLVGVCMMSSYKIAEDVLVHINGKEAIEEYKKKPATWYVILNLNAAVFFCMPCLFVYLYDIAVHNALRGILFDGLVLATCAIYGFIPGIFKAGKSKPIPKASPEELNTDASDKKSERQQFLDKLILEKLERDTESENAKSSSYPKITGDIICKAIERLKDTKDGAFIIRISDSKNHYIQFRLPDDESHIFCESSSNTFHLSGGLIDESNLRKLGWNEPMGEELPNYWKAWPRDASAEVICNVLFETMNLIYSADFNTISINEV